MARILKETERVSHCDACDRDIVFDLNDPEDLTGTELFGKELSTTCPNCSYRLWIRLTSEEVKEVGALIYRK